METGPVAVMPLDAVLPSFRALGERPLFPVAVYLCLGIASYAAFPVSPLAGLLVFLVLFALTAILYAKKADVTLPLVALSLAAGYALASAALPAWAGDPWEPSAGAKLSGRIAEATTTAGGYDGYVLENVTIDGAAVAGNVALTAGRGAARGQVGDTLSAPASLARPRPSLYYGGFNTRGWYMRKGVRFTGFAAAAEVTPSAQNESPLTLPEHARQYARGVLYRYMSHDSAALVDALLSGETGGIRWETRRDFADLGVAHLLAVSGLNISLTAGAAWLLCRKLRLPMAVSLAVSFCVMAGYVLFAGLTPSVLRAASMWLVAMGALVAARRYDPLSSLSAAAILILAVNPLDLFDAGFQLSFAATAAIFLWAAPMLRFVPDKKWMKGFAGAVGVTVCVTFFALPIILGYFNNVSLFSPLANLVLVPSSFVMQLAGTALLFVGFLPDVASLLGGMLDGYATFYLHNVKMLSWSASTVTVATPPLWLAAVFAALVLLVSPAVVKFRPGGGGRIAAVAALAVAAAVMLTPVSAAFTWRSGAAVVAEGPPALSVWWREGGRNYAACAGDWEQLSGYLASRGIGWLDGLYVLSPSPPPEGALSPGRTRVDRLYCPAAWFSDPEARPFLGKAALLGMSPAAAESGPFECVDADGLPAALFIPAEGGRMAFLPQSDPNALAAVKDSMAGAGLAVLAQRPAAGGSRLLAEFTLKALVLPGNVAGAGYPQYNIADAGSVEVENKGGAMALVPWIGGWADGIQGNFR